WRAATAGWGNGTQWQMCASSSPLLSPQARHDTRTAFCRTIWDRGRHG
ncbi:MAG: hypothetical protein AVDCRST_MAG88-3839, partial [uncultured Thermomicrobiales bacterium]